MRDDTLLLEDIRRHGQVALDLMQDVQGLRDQLALERAVFIIGEAATRLRPSTRARIDQPWTQIIGLRNLLAHQYERIRLERLIEITHQHIPPLLDALDP